MQRKFRPLLLPHCSTCIHCCACCVVVPQPQPPFPLALTCSTPNGSLRPCHVISGPCGCLTVQHASLYAPVVCWSISLDLRELLGRRDIPHSFHSCDAEHNQQRQNSWREKPCKQMIWRGVLQQFSSNARRRVRGGSGSFQSAVACERCAAAVCWREGSCKQ